MSSPGADLDYLLATFDTAAAYLRRNRIERTTVAAGLPADGYGYVGVCNDSNATIELRTRGTTSAFPLLRAAELDAQPDLADGLDATIRTLPKDGDGLADVALRRRRDATVSRRVLADVGRRTRPSDRDRARRPRVDVGRAPTR